MTLHKKRSFPLRISSVNVTKFAVSCGFGHIYWRNPEWKTSFFCAVWFYKTTKRLLQFVRKVLYFTNSNYLNVRLLQLESCTFTLFCPISYPFSISYQFRSVSMTMHSKRECHSLKSCIHAERWHGRCRYLLDLTHSTTWFWRTRNKFIVL